MCEGDWETLAPEWRALVAAAFDAASALRADWREVTASGVQTWAEFDAASALEAGWTETLASGAQVWAAVVATSAFDAGCDGEALA